MGPAERGAERRADRKPTGKLVVVTVAVKDKVGPISGGLGCELSKAYAAACYNIVQPGMR
jgi:hypothetical protein